MKATALPEQQGSTDDPMILNHSFFMFICLFIVMIQMIFNFIRIRILQLEKEDSLWLHFLLSM